MWPIRRRVWPEPWSPAPAETLFPDLKRQWDFVWPDFSSPGYQDALTRVPNRRAWDEGLALITEMAIVQERRFCLLIIDMDHFKQVNDTYGHPVGDAVLKTFVAAIQPKLRSGDLLCRYGGEEFGVLLPGLDGPSAVTAAERIRAAVERTKFDVGKGEAIPKTCSIGVAAWPTTSRDPAALVKAADKALYEAKKGGRNKVAIA